MYAILAKAKLTTAQEARLLPAFAKAAEMKNACLELQFTRAAEGERLNSNIDLRNAFRTFSFGSDYKDQIADRVAEATSKWYRSENLRYKLYWEKLERHQSKPVVEEDFKTLSYPFLVSVSQDFARRNDYKNHVKNLSRKQIIIGKPQKSSKTSLAFSVRKEQQTAVKISEKTVSVNLPKFGRIKGKHNGLLPTNSDYLIKKISVKIDACGDIWISIIVDGNRPRKDDPPKPEGQRTLVGIDMGLKNLRTAVAVDEETLEKKEVFQPERQRFFAMAFESLTRAYRLDRRAIPFIYRKMTRRRRDNTGKDIEKIMRMGDVFKLGKPSSALLFSGRLARSAADAANSDFCSRLVKRAQQAGKDAGEVDESYTSVTCRLCGSRRKMKLSDRVFVCTACKHEEDRDENSAYLIALRPLKTEEDVTNGALPRQRMKASKGRIPKQSRKSSPSPLGLTFTHKL